VLYDCSVFSLAPLLLAIGLARTAPPEARAAQSVDFRWDAPAGCPPAPEVLAQLEQTLGRPLEAEGPGPRLTVIARVRREGSDFDLRLYVVREGHKVLTRTLSEPQCHALAETSVLIVAMTMELALPHPNPIQPEAAPKAVVKPAPREPADPTPPPAPAPADPPFQLGLRVDLGMSYGDLPGLSVLLRLTTALVWRRLRVELTASYAPPREHPLQPEQPSRAHFQLISGILRACPVVALRRVQFLFCGGTEIGVLLGRAPDFDAAPVGRQVLAALHFTPAVHVHLSPRIRLATTLEGALHLVRPNFTTSTSKDSLYRSALASVRFLLGLEFRVL